MTPALESKYNLLIVFLLYGLAFFTVAIAVALQWRKNSQLPLTKALPALATFALLHGLHAWLEMLLLIRTELLQWGQALSAQFLSAVIGNGAYLFLFWFGIELVTHSRRNTWRWLPLLPFLLWGGASLWIVTAEPLATIQTVDLIDNLGRYLVGLPGGAVAAWGLYRHRKVFFNLGMSSVASSCSAAGASLLLYVLLTCLVAAPMSYPPASFLNFGAFAAVTRVPVLVPRAVLALVATYFLVRILRAYEAEQEAKLRRLDEERYRAQQETLEVQLKAEVQLRSWNAVLERNMAARTLELQRRQREAEALNEIGTLIASLADQSAIAAAVAEQARTLLEADLATVVLVGQQQTEDLRLAAISGNRTEVLVGLKIRHGTGLLNRVISLGAPVILDDYLSDPYFTHSEELDAAVKAEGLRAHLAVPMKAGGNLLGVISVAARGTRRFNIDDQLVLSRLALFTSIGIEVGCLHSRSQRVAVMEERERISREIHDGLAQALGSVTIIARAAQDQLKIGGNARTHEKLELIEQIAHEGFQDARQVVRDLRTERVWEQGLVQILENVLQRFGSHTRVETEMTVGDDWPTSLPVGMEIQVVRVVQESLANVRKHADASRVRLSLAVVGDYGEIAVKDNGRGFDPAKVAERDGTHFGLQSMRARAMSEGGYLLVQTAPGEGTSVVLGVPLPGNSGPSKGITDRRKTDTESMVSGLV